MMPRSRSAGAALARAAGLAVAAVILLECGRVGEKAAGEVLHAIDQGKVMGTKGTMETLATALSGYSVDRGGYPAGDSIDQATAALIPAFLHAPVGPDDWGHAFSYHSDGRSYTIVAPGADGVEGTADDLVMVDGKFTRLPAPTAP